MSHKVKCTIEKKNTPIDQFIILNFSKYMCQGWGVRKIAKSTKVPNDEILGAKQLSLYEKIKFFQLPKGKVSPLWHLALLEHSPALH